MKKYLIALFGLATFFLTGCGSQEEVQKQGDIQSIRVKSYEAVDVNGEWVAGAIDSSCDALNSLYEFDAEGYLVALSDYENIEDLKLKKVYAREGKRVDTLSIYDEKGMLKSKETFEYADGFMKAHYIYHKCGKLIEKTVYENDGKQVIASRNYGEFDQHDCPFTTDSTVVDAVLIDSIFHAQQKDMENRVEPYSVYTYKFKDDKMVESDYGQDNIQYEWQGDDLSKMISEDYETSVTYDDHHNIIEVKNGHISGMSSCQPQKMEHFFYEYQYDDRGSWIRRIDFEGEEKSPVRIVEREIVYR